MRLVLCEHMASRSEISFSLRKWDTGSSPTDAIDSLKFHGIDSGPSLREPFTIYHEGVITAI